MITRHYEGFRYQIRRSPMGYGYRIKPPQKGSRWIASKKEYATHQQARNAALEAISRAAWEKL